MAARMRQGAVPLWSVCPSLLDTSRTSCQSIRRAEPALVSEPLDRLPTMRPIVLHPHGSPRCLVHLAFCCSEWSLHILLTTSEPPPWLSWPILDLCYRQA